jgi:hypothetical protein
MGSRAGREGARRRAGPASRLRGDAGGTPKGVTEFLLVPYFGACLHVPPPPSNQIVHVFPKAPVPEDLAMNAVWVVGTMKTVQVSTKMGAAGYQIRGEQVEKYERR